MYADWSKQYTTWYKGGGVIIKNRDNRLLLVKDLKTGKWSFPKGAPEAIDNHDPMNTAIRECREEVGLTEGIHYKINEPYPHRFAYDRYYFMASFIEGNNHFIKYQAEEVVAVEWVSMEELRKIGPLLNSGVREYLRLYTPRGQVSKYHQPRNSFRSSFPTPVIVK